MTLLKNMDKLKILGILSSPKIKVTIIETLKGIVKNIKATAQKWIGDRNWTMKGKTKIIHIIPNVPRMVCKTNPPLSLPCPQAKINEIEKMISHYLFHDQVERIRLDKQYKPTEV